MNKRILFLYFTPQEKAEAIYCFNIFKAVMRKFRKGISASFMQICTDKACLGRMSEIYEKEVPRYDAVILCSSDRSTEDKDVFFKKIAIPSVSEYHMAGKVICSPFSYFSSTIVEEQISETVKSDSESIRNAAAVATQLAKSRKHTLTICTCHDSEIDRILFRECEYAVNHTKHIYTEHVAAEELIRLLINSFPSADVILTTDRWRKIILMLLASRFENGPVYSVQHTKQKKIYCRKGLMCNNSGRISLLFAFSAILENEFKMQNAAYWLRRCMGIVLSEQKHISAEELSSLLILEINKSMRQRKPILRGIINENTN